MNSSIVGVAFAIALAIAAIYWADAWETVHKPVMTDPVAQRIAQLNSGDLDYNKMVTAIVQAAKKDTVIIYRDTCK
jgi:hypothetical protein